jgi:hypothetical protein
MPLGFSEMKARCRAYVEARAHRPAPVGFIHEHLGERLRADNGNQGRRAVGRDLDLVHERRSHLKALRYLSRVGIDDVDLAVGHAAHVGEVGSVEGDDVRPGSRCTVGWTAPRHVDPINRRQILEFANMDRVAPLTRHPQLSGHFDRRGAARDRGGMARDRTYIRVRAGRENKAKNCCA